MKSSFIIKFLSAVNAKPPTVNTSEAKPEGEAGSVQTNAKGQRQRHLRLKKLVGKTKDKMAAIAVCLRDAGHSATVAAKHALASAKHKLSPSRAMTRLARACRTEKACISEGTLLLLEIGAMDPAWFADSWPLSDKQEEDRVEWTNKAFNTLLEECATDPAWFEHSWPPVLDEKRSESVVPTDGTRLSEVEEKRRISGDSGLGVEEAAVISV